MDPISQLGPTTNRRLVLLIAGGVVLVVGVAGGIAVWRARMLAPAVGPVAVNSPAASGVGQPSPSSGVTAGAQPVAPIPGETTGPGPFSIETGPITSNDPVPELNKDFQATAEEKRAWGYPVDAQVVYRWQRARGGAIMRVIVSAPVPAPQQIPTGALKPKPTGASVPVKP